VEASPATIEGRDRPRGWREGPVVAQSVVIALQLPLVAYRAVASNLGDRDPANPFGNHAVLAVDQEFGAAAFAYSSGGPRDYARPGEMQSVSTARRLDRAGDVVGWI